MSPYGVTRLRRVRQSHIPILTSYISVTKTMAVAAAPTEQVSDEHTQGLRQLWSKYIIWNIAFLRHIDLAFLSSSSIGRQLLINHSKKLFTSRTKPQCSIKKEVNCIDCMSKLHWRLGLFFVTLIKKITNAVIITKLKLDQYGWRFSVQYLIYPWDSLQLANYARHFFHNIADVLHIMGGDS